MNIPAQKCDTERYSDLQVENEGSIFLVHPLTDAGARFIGENTDPDNRQFLGRALAVEHRYIEAFVEGARDSGLKVI